MSTPVEGGRGLRLRLLGFPVHVDLSFVVVMGLIGFASGVRRWDLLLLWILVAAVALLVHELGHALVARTTRARPAIALTGFGGLTTYVPPGPLSRARTFAIAVAGPGVGLVVAAVLWLVDGAFGSGLAGDGYPRAILDYGFFTTFWWSVLNLMPLLPLDGGKAMRELLPGEPPVRERRAAVVSLVVIAPLLVLAIMANQLWLAMFLVFFGVANAQTLRETPGAAGRPASRRPGAGAAPAGLPPGVSPEQAVVGLLWQGAPVQARHVLESLPEGTPVDLAVHGTVLAATGEPEQGLALLHQEVARRPGDGNVVALLVLAHVLRHDWAAVEADLTGPLSPDVPLPLVERAMQEASAAARPDVVARLAALPRPQPRQAG